MFWNVVELAENGRYVKLSRGFLLVMDGQQELGRVVIDEINCLMLTADQSTLSKPVLVRLAEEGVPVIICGGNYHPISISLPYASHHQYTKVLQYQLASGKPLRKRLWQFLVKRKIANQSKVLKSVFPKSNVLPLLDKLVGKVRSGDPENIEAQAAKLYWRALFGENFRRNIDAETGVNTALNYGYAIIRAACARAIVAAGLTPALGVHHKNMNNPFCLVDDFMEVFRPLVDWLVYQIEDLESLEPTHKHKLASVLQVNIQFAGKQTIFVHAIQGAAYSLVDCYKKGKADLLLPNLLFE